MMTIDTTSTALLSLRDWNVRYPIKTGLWQKVTGYIPAVSHVDLDIYRGEIVAVVGESGCGKSTLGLSLVGLAPIHSGTMTIEGKVVNPKNKSDLDIVRSNIQMIFQDVQGSLNPRQTIYEILSEPMRVHGMAKTKSALLDRVVELLESVGLSSDALQRFPHAFSGGQRQRISIARVLGLKPKMLVCDEIVSALDISVAAQIVQLLLKLKNEYQLSLLFIAHDLALVESLADRVLVAYMGQIVESGSVEQVMNHPAHPYTQALLNAVPRLGVKERPKVLAGEIPSWQNLPQGCRFYNRCSYCTDECTQSIPTLNFNGNTNTKSHQVACIHPLHSNAV